MKNKSLDIRESIIANLYRGKMDINTKLPSINKSVKIYDASESTIKNAYNLLVSIGVLYKKQGVGYFVSSDWFNRVIKSPTLDKYITKIEAIEIKNPESEFFDWEIDKKIIRSRKRIGKFYYNNGEIQKYSTILVSKEFSANPKIEVFESSFISYLYNNNIHPQSEKINIISRPSTEKEAKILGIKKGQIIISTKIYLFDKLHNEICRTVWIEKTNTFNFNIHRQNY